MFTLLWVSSITSILRNIISLTLTQWDSNGNTVKAFFHSLDSYVLDSYYKKCTLPNKENQKELVHKNKLINVRSEIYQIIKYFFLKYIYYQIYGELSSL